MIFVSTRFVSTRFVSTTFVSTIFVSTIFASTIFVSTIFGSTIQSGKLFILFIVNKLNTYVQNICKYRLALTIKFNTDNNLCTCNNIILIRFLL